MRSSNKELLAKLRSTREKHELVRLKEKIEQKITRLEKHEDELDRREESIESDEINIQKLIEFTSQSYSSFYNTTLEKDKSMLTLSVAGLGFLITFLNKISEFSLWHVCLFFVAVVTFLICIFTVISIFGKNSVYISHLVNDNPEYETVENQLAILDKRAIRCFYIGIMASVIFGCFVAWENKGNSKKEQNKAISAFFYYEDDVNNQEKFNS